MSERRTIKVGLFTEFADEMWSLADFLELVAAARDKVPAEYRGAARVELSGDYGGIVSLRAYYLRPETDAEVRYREQQDREYEARRQAEERRKYERLKAKFEPG